MSGRLDGDTKESSRKDKPGGLSQSEWGGREAWCNDRTSVSCSVSVLGFGIPESVQKGEHAVAKSLPADH